MKPARAGFERLKRRSDLEGHNRQLAIEFPKLDRLGFLIRNAALAIPEPTSTAVCGNSVVEAFFQRQHISW